MNASHLLTATLALLLLRPAQAQEWLGTIDDNWNDPANWSDWPLGGENVTIDPSFYTGAQASPVLSGNSVFIPDRLFIENGAQVTLQGALTVADRLIVGSEAEVTMNSGTLNSDRLIMEGGGAFVLANGTINVQSVLALGDDGVVPSRFEQLNGAVNVTGELGFDVELLPSTPTYQLIAGTLTVNGDAVWAGASPGSGQGRLLVEGGTVQINGSTMNTAGSTVDLYIDVKGGDLILNGPALDLAHATDSVQQSSGTWVMDNALTVECDGVIHCTGGDQQVVGQVELRGSGTIRWHNVETDNQSSLQHTGPDELQVSGNWLRAGTFDADNNTVAFIGGGTQQVIGTDFHGLRIANTGPGVDLSVGTTTVAGALVLDNGVLFTSDIAMLEVLHNATSTPGSASSHVDGPMRKIGNDDFVFPTGANGAWRRIAVSGINDQDTEFTARHVDGAFTNTMDLGPSLVSVSDQEHWILERAVTTDDARVELYWEDAAQSGLVDCSTLVVAAWNGSQWTAGPSTTTGSCTGNDAGSVITDGPGAVFQAFTFGVSDSTLVIAERGASVLLPHPQPANDRAWVPVPGSTTDLDLFDATGQHVRSVVRTDPTASHLMVTTDALPSGLYLVRASARGQVLAHGRLIVTH